MSGHGLAVRLQLDLPQPRVLNQRVHQLPAPRLCCLDVHRLRDWLWANCFHLTRCDFFLNIHTLSLLSGELLPSDMRSLGCGLLGVLDNISLFVSVKAVPSLVSSLGMHGAFALYSSFCLMNIIVSFFVMPETKGLSLEEIEDSYKKRERRISEHI